ncbi:MAG: hypothetical protein WCH44_06935 [Betaproteobacteria bacterium]
MSATPAHRDPVGSATDEGGAGSIRADVVLGDRVRVAAMRSGAGNRRVPGAPCGLPMVAGL